jgi:hypothetical protein
MRTLFAILVVGLVAFVIWRGWIQLSVTNQADKTDTTLTINKDQIKQDVNTLKKDFATKPESK